MSKVIFLNHSCVLVDSGKTKILCDPWFEGTAFQDGWSLLYDQSHNINDLDFDYIWISHEHPDHFSIPTLNQLNKAQKFLYQETEDKKVKIWLESKGHSVTELPHKQTTRIEDIEITSFTCDGHDSSLLFRFDNNSTFLNLNDSRIEKGKQLELEILDFVRDKAVDLVGIQFSYANWAGNEGDRDIPFHQQCITDQKIKYAMEILKPKSCLLFASFIYFSHEENYYWNENFFVPHVLELFNGLETEAILPLPNETIELSKTFNKKRAHKNDESMKFWSKLHNNAPIKKSTVSVDNLDLIKEHYFTFFDKLWDKNDATGFLKSGKTFSIKMFLEDINKKVEIKLFSKEFSTLDFESEVDFSVSSETLIFLLKNSFSRGTISINSRIKFNYNFAHRFFIFFFIFFANNIGRYFDKKNPLKKEDLNSIANLKVMMSIFKFNDQTLKNFQDDLNELFG